MPSANLFAALALCLSTQALAIEGMWQPHQLPKMEDQLRAQGLAIDPSRISDLTKHPMNAVVGLGFCTASFVSPLGLTVTNHHCAYGSIQFNSTAEKNLLKQGFYAKLLGDELRAEPTMRIFVTESIADVTQKVRTNLPASGRNRFDAIDARTKKLVAACEASKGYRCDVYVFHGGAQYFLIKQLEIRDVRLVYAPANAIGKYGGDVDNWMWPRHTGDFAFYRAYVGPDGKPADPNESNVPYRPKSYLRVSREGVSEGDFAMIAGYPGRTNRYRLAEEVGDAIQWQYPKQIAHNRAILALIDQHTKERPDAAVKYASSVASINNGLKNAEGNLDGFRAIDAVGIKSAEEAAILEWAKTNAPEGLAGYQGLKDIVAEIRSRRDRDQLLGLIGGSGLIATARDAYRLSIERAKPDAQRQLGYQKRDEIRIQGRFQVLDRRFDPQVDRALLAYALERYLQLPTAQRLPELDAWIGVGIGDGIGVEIGVEIGGRAEGSNSLAQRLDALYAGTKVAEQEPRSAWLTMDRKALEASDDSALKFAVAMMPAWLRMEDQVKTAQGNETVVRPQWMNARIAFAAAQGKQLYPDANSSLRVTFGQIKGYPARDGLLALPFTHLDGIVQKHTGVDPFDATAKQLELIRAKRFGPYAKDGSVPVNFLADLDITGGNSGSPMMNKKAELIGLAFDGNYEAISSGWLFDEVKTRTIGVDARYMLWVMDAVDQADRLIEEMGLKPEL